MNIVSSKALKKNKKNLNFKVILTIVLLFFIITIIIDSKTYIDESKNAILLWAGNVLPSLYIFFIFSKLLIELDCLSNLTNFLFPLFNKIFKTSKYSVVLFFLSMLSGFPVGAMLIKNAYEKGQIDSNEVHKLTSFCSLTGPAFIFGSVSAIMLNNFHAGIIIYFSHIISAIINGFIFRNYKCKNNKNCLNYNEKQIDNNILSQAITSSINSILMVGGYIVFFYIIVQILINTNILPNLLFPINYIFNTNSLPFISGLLEVTKGCKEIAASFNINTATCLISFLISFSGFCINLQSFHFLKKCEVKFSFYILQKLLHATLSLLITLPLSLLL